jgi:hypothetical protein
LLAGNSTQIPAISSVPHEDRGEKDDPDPEAFDVGLLWLVHRDKMVRDERTFATTPAYDVAASPCPDS